MDDPLIVWDEEGENLFMQDIFEHRDANAAGGEGAADDRNEDFEQFASQFLNPSGEGILEEEEITASTSNTLHIEVYIWILYLLEHKMH